MVESFISTIAGLGTVFGWAFLSFWSAIPAGIALNLSPLLVIVTVTLSYSAGVILVVMAGTPLRKRIRRRMLTKSTPVSNEDNPQESRMIIFVRGAWARYGLIGLAILTPMTVGAQIGAVIGLSLGISSIRLIIAMTIGAGLWAIAITLAVIAGVMTVS